MSNLTTLPKGDSAWLLRKSIQRIMQQVSVLETNIGSSTTGNSSNTQVIFNDNGTLRGDAGLTYNAATDTLSAGSATITGDLTVDTSTLVVNSSQDRVAIGFSGNASSGRLQINQPLGSTIDGALRITDNATTSFVFNNVSSGVSGIWSSGAIAFGVGSGTFTEAMRLNSTGLGVGASPVVPLHIFSGGTGTTDFGNVVGTFRTGASGRAVALQFSDTSNFANIGMLSGALQFAAGGSTTHMTISTAGNVGIGVTPSAWGSAFKAIQQVNYGTSFFSSNGGSSGIASNCYNDGTNWLYSSNNPPTRYEFGVDAGNHRWFSAVAGTGTIAFGAAKMTLDASGNLLVGVTSASNQERLNVSSAVSLYVARVFNTASSGGNYGIAIRYSNAAPNNGSNEFLACSDSAASRAFIYSNGGIANYQANDVSLSDSRMKSDIKPLGSYWNKIKSLEIVTFKYNDQTHSDDNIGLIAQQVESVAPELVDVDGFGETPADGVPLKTIYTTDLYHAAIKALQEAMTRIEVLEAKLA